VRINEAHRRLKEPLARATYLCELGGHPLLGADAKAVAPDVLARQMQWHEALAEASSADVIRALDAEVRDRLEAVRAEVACELDDRQDPRAAAGRLREWMFLARLRSEIERRLEALEV
jgi:molecular chaperone HscB